jgi:hypothetical protein
MNILQESLGNFKQSRILDFLARAIKIWVFIILAPLQDLAL